MKTIKVYSEGQVFAKSNMIEIRFDFNINNIDYSVLMNEGSEKYQKLLKILEQLNINSKLKTLDYKINTKTENVLDEFNHYHLKNVGFVLNHNLSLSIKFDLKLLNDILNAICKEEIKPLINIKFTINNSDKYIKKARELAVKNAIAEGNQLANYANVTIKEIVNLEYNCVNNVNHSNTNFAPMLMRSLDYTNINPEELKFKEGVTITFEII